METTGVSHALQEWAPKECEHYQTIVLISHTHNILLKIIFNRLQKKISEAPPEE